MWKNASFRNEGISFSRAFEKFRESNFTKELIDFTKYFIGESEIRVFPHLDRTYVVCRFLVTFSATFEFEKCSLPVCGEQFVFDY